MLIPRQHYIRLLSAKRDNGRIKIITGIRRCGKSYLLNVLYRQELKSAGVGDDQIIFIALDNDENIRYRNPLLLGQHIRQLASDSSSRYYVLIDEIQNVATVPNPYLPGGAGQPIGFTDVLLGLARQPNIDVYVTGSNSRMLSADIVTEFRDRGDEIRLAPLTYAEFCSAYSGPARHAWRDYTTFGGMPYVMQLDSPDEKARYLQDLFQITYVRDVIERNHIRGDRSTLDDLLNITASVVGSLTNPTRLANTFASVKGQRITNSTVAAYLDCFVDAFILRKAVRYDIKGRAYIGTPLKYYFTDVGLRNARLNFRQQEENHIMENVLFNELTARGLCVDVGVVERHVKTADGTKRRQPLEVDFVVRHIDRQYYIQSALTVADEEKRMQEVNSLMRIDDSFQKIVVVKDDIRPWTDDHGIQYVNVEDFLLDRIDRLTS